MKNRFVRLACALALAGGSVAAVMALTAGPAGAAAHPDASVTGCVGHAFHYSEDIEIHYTPGCTGHDEPELDPVSALPGSAKDLTWTIQLPGDGTYPESSLGFGFWTGGATTDENPKALFGQAFQELQFYPDTLVSRCGPNGGFTVTHVPDTWTSCSPVWQVVKEHHDYIENAAFNGMLPDGNTNGPLVMHSGDVLTIHYFVTKAKDGWHITVTDRTTGHSGTIVLNSPTNGALNPAFNVQKIGNSLGWGIVHDTPASFVWEIGHGDLWGTPPAKFCLPGNVICNSYDAAHWAGTKPIRIQGVTFADGSKADTWATVSDYGGADEIRTYGHCPVYGAPYCMYPWYAFDGKSFTFGVDYPGTKQDFGQTAQYQTWYGCGGPFGPKSTYCDTIIKQPKS